MQLYCTGRERHSEPLFPQIGWLWDGPDAKQLPIDELRASIPLEDCEGFDSDLRISGRAHVTDDGMGHRHHVPMLRFLAPVGVA